MKKLILALFVSVCSLIFSLSGSAQTVIMEAPDFPVSQLRFFQNLSGDLFVGHYNFITDSTKISKISGIHTLEVFKTKGYVRYDDIIFGDDIFICSGNDTTYIVNTDGSGSEILINQQSFPMIIKDDLVAIVASNGFGQSLIVMNVDSKIITDTVLTYQVSNNTNAFIRSSGLVDNELYFSISGVNHSTIYSYNLISTTLNLVEINASPDQDGRGYHDVFAYNKSSGSDKIRTRFVWMEDNFDITTDRVGSGFSAMMLSPDKDLVLDLGSTKLVFNGSISVWNAEYPFYAARWQGSYLWTEYDSQTKQHMILSYDKFGDQDTTIVATFSGSLSSDLKVSGNRVYAIRSLSDSNIQQVISFDLLCPESLTITQSMVDAGQTLFEAQHIDVKGLINISSDIIIRANNDIEMSPTSAFYVVDGGSVEIRPYVCSNNN